MSLPIFIPLAEAEKYSSDNVSMFAKKASQLISKGVQFAHTVCIPPQTLHQLHHRHAQTRNELLKLYHDLFLNDFVTVYFFHTDTSEPDSVENIKGDANLIHTLEELSNHHSVLPILIQLTPQPSYSGFATSLESVSLSKKKIEIIGVSGVYHPERSKLVNKYLVDVRTMKVVSRKDSSHNFKLIRKQDSLQLIKATSKPTSNVILEQLAKQVLLIKQQQLSHQQVRWFVQDSNIYIQSFTEFTEHIIDSTHQPLCMGEKLVSGYVEGQAVFEYADLDQVAHPILIVEEITSKHLPILKKVNGIIVEKGIRDNLALQTITSFHIPTIVHARFATQKIKPSQKIMLDAASGRVVQPSSLFLSKQHNTSKTPNLYCLTGNANDALLLKDATAPIGALFSSNAIFAAAGIHPLSLSTNEKKRVKAQLVEAQNKLVEVSSDVLYMPFSLDSSTRTKLRHATVHETLEPNPAFGLRGSSFLLKNLDLLSFELSLAKQNTTFVLPYVSQASDALLLARHILNQNKYLQVAAHLTSLAAISQIQSLQLTKVIIDLDYLLAGWDGIDPQLKENQQKSGDSQFWKFVATFTKPYQEKLYFLARSLSPTLYAEIKKVTHTGLITTSRYLTAVK